MPGRARVRLGRLDHDPLERATSIVGLTLPDYVSWLWGRGVSPVGLPDAAAFGLICQLLVDLPQLLPGTLAGCATRLAEARAALVRIARPPSLSAQARPRGGRRARRQTAAPRDQVMAIRALGGALRWLRSSQLSISPATSELYRQIPAPRAALCVGAPSAGISRQALRLERL